MSTLGPEQLVQEASIRGVVLALAVADLKPRRVLEILAEGGLSHRVSIQYDGGCITVEIGNGLVVGAEARLDGETLTGRQAYALLRKLDEGSMRVEPLRFPSLANILQPVAELPDLFDSVPPPAVGDPTVELLLPEARPIHQTPDPTARTQLPEPLSAAILAMPDPPPVPDLELPQGPAEAIGEAPTSARALVPAAAAAALLLLLGVSAVGVALGASSDAGSPPVIARVIAPIEPVEPTLRDEGELGEVDLELTLDEVERHAARLEARELARTAREHLHRGERAPALRAARRAAELRGSLPYYQVVLGDALTANGQRPAARRAYRRALRLRPNYEPALRRLGRARARDRGAQT